MKQRYGDGVKVVTVFNNVLQPGMFPESWRIICALIDHMGVTFILTQEMAAADQYQEYRYVEKASTICRLSGIAED
jgi:hypothetical protein